MQNATKCNPTRRVFRAFGSHVHDQILLHSKMNRIGVGYFVERMIQNILHGVLDDNVQLMWDTPNLEHMVVALLFKQSDNSFVSTGHRVLPSELIEINLERQSGQRVSSMVLMSFT